MRGSWRHRMSGCAAVRRHTSQGKEMNWKKWFGATLLLATFVASTDNASADEQGEADFRALRKKVNLLRASEPAAVQKLIAEATSKVRDCFPGTPEPQWGSRAGTAVEDVDYLYGNPAASADGSIRCIYVVEPLHRALTLEEAYDFSAALIMPDLQHSVEGKAGRAAAKLRAEDAAREGEQNFAEIRRMVAARTLRLKDEAALKDLAMTIGSVGNLRDCSKVSSLELQERVVIGPATPRNRVVYNDTYQWDDIDPSGNRCIYMKWPLDRGLSADEARDFMDALQLDMGFSPEISREMEAEKVAPSADEKKIVKPR